VSKKGLKRVTATRYCGELLSEYCQDINLQYKDVFADCVADYNSLVLAVKGRNADADLKTAYYKQELDIKALMSQYEIKRAQFCKIERETRILNDDKMFSYEHTRYIGIDTDELTFETIKSIIEKYPYLYGRKKKSSLINVVDRSILFRIMLNNGILDSKFYREMRIARIIEHENNSKKDINYIFKKFY
jgi:hypothetical protein